MTGKKILTDVVITRRKKENSAVPPAKASPIDGPAPVFVVRRKTDTTGFFRKLKIHGIAVIFIISASGLLFASAVRNSKMVIAITPKSDSFAVDKNLVMVNANSFTGGESISFIVATSTLRRSGSFPAENNTVGGRKAEGTVVIFNKFSKEGQILIASTRLASPDGKIYRIPSTIVVPGLRIEKGKTIPGSKEVKVVADQPGPDYNAELTDFTIPGFKDSSKYNSFFARSKTKMTGGSSGAAKIVTKNAVEAAVGHIKDDVNKNLKNIVSKTPLPDFFILPGSEEFEILSVETTPSIGEEAEVFELKLTGEVRRVLVKNNDIAKALAKGGADQTKLGFGAIRITNFDKLAFRLSGYKFGVETFNMNIKGSANIEIALDPETIKNQLVENGITRADGVLNTVSGAARAEVEFKPFWAGTLPKSLSPVSRADHIDITIVSR